MRRCLLTILLVLTTCLSALPQAIGSWKLYPSFRSVQQIEPTGKMVYVLASDFLYSYNLSDGAITTYDRTNSLHSTDIAHIRWVPATQSLVIAYKSCDFDMLTASGDVIYNTDIRDKQMGGAKAINSIYVDGQAVYICTSFGIVRYDSKNGYITDSYILNRDVKYCYIESGYIYAAGETDGIWRCALNANLLNKNEWQYHAPYKAQEKEAYVYDKSNNCYWAGDSEGLLTKYTKEQGEMQPAASGVIPDGPFNNNFWRLYLHDGKLYGTSGVYSAGMAPNVPGMIQYMENDTWQYLDPPSPSMIGNDYKDVNCMAFDPKDKSHFWAGGVNGLFEYRNNRIVKFYNATNSIAPPLYNSSTTDALVTSMVYDPTGTLWPLFGWTDNTVTSVGPDGNIKVYEHPENNFSNLYAVDPQGVFISPTNGFMWWAHSYYQHPAVMRYDYKTDNLVTYKTLVDQDGNTYKPDYTYTVKEDRKSNLWVATTNGPLYSTSEQISKSTDDVLYVTKHKVPRNDGTNYADYLLDGIEIRCIAIDAINRKWFGTSGNGIYVISSDNNTQVAHFTTAETPLLSDYIYDITIDQETGLVYIATDRGLCAYQSDIRGDINVEGEMTKDNVWAYPNPVTPDHTGDITIVGLAENTDIKIVTSSGRLVHSGRCAGGSYLWDGCDMDGQRVASGMYMVLVAKSDGSKGVVTKIGIVR